MPAPLWPLSTMTASPPSGLVPVLILLTGVATLSINMFAPSLVHIADDFSVDYATASLSVSLFLAITAILQLVIGPLADRFGRRPVLLVTLFLFTLASLGCMAADTIAMFLICRMLQGAIVAGSVLSRVVIQDVWAPKDAVGMVGTIGMAMALAPMLGPMLGGGLDAMFGWRASFAAFAGAGALLLVLAYWRLPETRSGPVATFAEQRRQAPILIRSALFWAYAVTGAFSVGAFYVFITAAPLVAATTFGMPPEALGLYLGSISGGFVFGSYLTRRLSRTHAAQDIMLAGRLLACTGLSLGILLFLAGVIHEFSLFGATIFVGIGNGLTMPGAAVGAMTVRRDIAGMAAGLSGALAVAAGAALTAFASWIITLAPGPVTLLATMLGVSAIGLCATIRVRQLLRDAAPETG